MTAFFMSVRALHALLGAVWLGALTLLTLLLMPAIQDAGPAGGAVMGSLFKRKIHAFMAGIAGLTVLSGVYLYWRYTNGFDPEVAGSMAMRIVGLGGVLGLAAAIIGGSVVARGTKKVMELMQAGKVEEAARVRSRTATASRWVLVLVFVAIVCMTVGSHWA
jgi:uncharacterized membrane protein